MHRGIIFFLFLNQLEQSRENTFLVHHFKCHLILAAIEKKKSGYQVKRIGRVFLYPKVGRALEQHESLYLQKTAHNLHSDIILVFYKEGGSDKLE